MKPSGTIKENVYNALAAALPAALTTAGIEDFTDYVKGTPSDADVKQCSVYIGPTSYEENFLERTIIVQMALPGEMEPDAYQDAADPVVFGLDAHAMAGALNKRYDVDAWHPNELKSGQSAFVVYAIKYSEELDSCDQF